MAIRTLHWKYVICPHCGKKHKECGDWVKSMPHREDCPCGKQFLCWFETVTTYHAEAIEPLKQPKSKQSKAAKRETKKRKGKKDRKKSKG
jgi:hypothetical protein